jgi:hypothetical protein
MIKVYAIAQSSQMARWERKILRAHRDGQQTTTPDKPQIIQD